MVVIGQPEQHNYCRQGSKKHERPYMQKDICQGLVVCLRFRQSFALIGKFCTGSVQTGSE